jgi:hypothetical protein
MRVGGSLLPPPSAGEQKVSGHVIGDITHRG